MRAVLGTTPRKAKRHSRHPTAQLTLPRAACAEDFHPRVNVPCRVQQVRAPCRAHHQKSRGPEAAVSTAMPMGYASPTNYWVTD